MKRPVIAEKLPCDELLEAGEVYHDAYLRCAAVAMHSSETAFQFANQCLAADRLPGDDDDDAPALGDCARREPCHLVLVDVPADLRGKSYADLVEYALQRGALPVGLRRWPAGRERPYVYTHPLPEDVLGDRDRAFVLRNSSSSLPRA